VADVDDDLKQVQEVLKDVHPVKRCLGIEVVVTYLVTSSAKVDQQLYNQNQRLIYHKSFHALEQRIIRAWFEDYKHKKCDKQLGEEIFAEFART
jgi:hypothetical protein